MKYHKSILNRILDLFRPKSVHKENISGSVTLIGRLTVRKISQDETESIRVLDDNKQNRSSSADLDLERNIYSTLEGPSPQGEADTLDVCRVFINKLNKEGGQWSEPAIPDGPERGIDCESRHGVETLNIQVTRAMSKQKFWQELANSESVEYTTTIGKATDELLKRIEAKKLSIPPVQLSEIVLILNALDTPSHSLNPVISDFKKRYSQSVRGLGFQAIWVVGPNDSLVSRLDI